MKSIFEKYASKKIGNEPVMTEEDFRKMEKDGLINYYRVRNRLIRDEYKELRSKKYRQAEAVNKLQLKYPLTSDSILRIAHGTELR